MRVVALPPPMGQTYKVVMWLCSSLCKSNVHRQTGVIRVQGVLFQGAAVVTVMRLSETTYDTNSARVTAAIVNGSQSSVVPRATLTARSPFDGLPSKNTTSPV